jgi:hypothetical protein
MPVRTAALVPMGRDFDGIHVTVKACRRQNLPGEEFAP